MMMMKKTSKRRNGSNWRTKAMKMKIATLFPQQSFRLLSRLARSPRARALDARIELLLHHLLSFLVHHVTTW